MNDFELFKGVYHKQNNLPQKVIYKTIQKPNALEGQKGYTMQRNEAVNTIKADLPRIIWQRDKSRTRYPGYICPICSSGSGKNGTGISTKDGIHYTCWAGCFTNQDVLSIIGLQNNTTDFNRQLEICCGLYGIDYRTLEADNGSAPKSTAAVKANVTEEPQADYSEFYISCVESAEACDYLQKRGISIETQKNMCVGYCKEWKHPKAPNAPASPRIIIPTSSGSYLARDTRSELTEDQAARYDEAIKSSWYKVPNATFELSNNNAEIHRLEGRIQKISAIKEAGTKEISEADNTGNELFKIVENVEIMRLQLIFEGKPNDKTRDILKHNGFKWSPSNQAWQRQLTDNAKYTLKRIKPVLIESL